MLRIARKTSLLFTVLCCAVMSNVEQVKAQSVVGANDSAGTQINQSGQTFDISGGTQAGANLFQSFQKFGLSQGETANFIANPSIQNILGRVVGGDASVINGIIKVTSTANPNLYLMNPAGIVFGVNASLNVPGSFTATTANGIGFGSNWFNAVDTNNYAALVGEPGSFTFTMPQPGAIINAGELAVGVGQDLVLLGGTVLSTGTLSAPSGNITVASVPGEKLVRISQSGSVLSFDLLVAPTTTANLLPFTPLSLPQLLTGGNATGATKVELNSDGTVRLTGTDLTAGSSDVVAKAVTAQSATLAADRNLLLPESRLRTTGDLTLLAKSVVVRDSLTVPTVIQAGGNLDIRGDQGIDLLTLKHPESIFQSGGNLSLVSDGIISGDAHFASGGYFSILTLSGQLGNFISLYDPIISSERDVVFGSYTGASLKVEAKGSITVNGDIAITGPDTSPRLVQPALGSDQFLLADSSTLILRAGVTILQEAVNVPQLNVPTALTNFTDPESLSSPGNITVTGNIAVGDITSNRSPISGPVIFSAPGNVIIGSASNPTNTGDIKTAGGSVVITATGNITTKDISTGGTRLNPLDGDTVPFVPLNYVSLTSVNGNVQVSTIDAGGGGINISAGGTFQAIGAFLQDFSGANGSNPSLIDFLVNQGYSRQQLAKQNFLPINGSKNFPVSLLVRPTGESSVIRIHTGNTSQKIAANERFSVLVDGNQPFVLGPNFTNHPEFIPADPTKNLSPYDLIRNPNGFNINSPFSFSIGNSTALTFPSSMVPSNASGTVGAIVIGGGSDAGLTASFQNRSYTPVVTAPTISTPTPTISTPTLSSEKPNSDIARFKTGTDGQDVQRQLASRSTTSACNSSGSPATSETSANTIATRAEVAAPNAANAVSSPCNTASDESQILQLIDISPGSSPVQALDLNGVLPKIITPTEKGDPKY